jgi:hypothetical protein
MIRVAAVADGHPGLGFVGALPLFVRTGGDGSIIATYLGIASDAVLRELMAV